MKKVFNTLFIFVLVLGVFIPSVSAVQQINSNEHDFKLKDKDFEIIKEIKAIQKEAKDAKKQFKFNVQDEEVLLTIRKEHGRMIFALGGKVKNKKAAVNKFKQIDAAASIYSADCSLGDDNYGMFYSNNSDPTDNIYLENKTEWCQTESAGWFGGQDRVETKEGGLLELYYWGTDPYEADSLEIDESITVTGTDIDFNVSWFPGYTINEDTNTISTTLTQTDHWYLKTTHDNLPFEGDEITKTEELYRAKVSVPGIIYRTSVNGDLTW